MSTVLVVEDEPNVLLAARLLLEAAGYQVIEASGGEEALRVVETSELDAVFLDLRMPDMDGWEVLETLQAKSTSSRLPVIVLSAHSSPDTVKRSVELGAKGYVRKPFKATDLTRALETVLAQAPNVDPKQ